MTPRGRDRTIVQLDCGLVVIAQRLGIPNVVSTQCWVRTGSIYDRESCGSGLSHFVEHMLACGSTLTRTAAESRTVLGRLGAQSDAFTGHDTVHYYVDTTSADAGVALELLSDWMQHALLSPDEFGVQRAVIENELATGRNDPAHVMSTLTHEALYGDHPARYPVIGHLEAFHALTLEAVRSSYETMYAPNNMALVVAGDVDPEQIVIQASKHWVNARPRSVPALALPLPPPFEGPRLVRRYGAGGRRRVRLAWPGARLGGDGDCVLDVLARILGRGASSRLTRTVRDRRRQATSVEAHHLSFSWGEGLFTVDAVPTSAEIDDVTAAIQAEIDQIQIDGVTSDELSRAKRKLVSAEYFVAQTVRAEAARLGRGFVQSAELDSLDRYASGVHEVGADSVRDAVGRFLRNDRLLTIHLLGKPEHEGGAEERAGLTRAMGRETSDALRPLAIERVVFDNAPFVQRLRVVAPPVAIGAAASTAVVGIRAVLPSGLRVVVERDDRLPIVAIEWRQVGGLLGDQSGREGIANAIAVMMTRGAGTRSAIDISRTMEELGASLRSGCNHSTSFVAAECPADEWRGVLGLLSDAVQRPRFSEAEWASIQPRIMAAIALHNEAWHRHLLAALRKAYFDGGHPWSQIDLGRPEVIHSLERDDLERAHTERLAASDSVLVVVGDVAVDDVLSEVWREFGQLSAQPGTMFDAPRSEMQPKQERIQASNAVACAQLAYGPGLTRRCPDYPALLVMNKALDRAPGGWLDEELRGRGLVYTLGVGMMAGAAPGYWSLIFNCQTSNAEEAMTRALGVVDRIRTETIDQATLEYAKTSALLSEALGLQSNAQRAKEYALDELMGYGFDDTVKLRDAIGSVDAEAVRDAAGRYLDTCVSVEIGS